MGMAPPGEGAKATQQGECMLAGRRGGLEGALGPVARLHQRQVGDQEKAIRGGQGTGKGRLDEAPTTALVGEGEEAMASQEGVDSHSMGQELAQGGGGEKASQGGRDS